jgi:beta-N-acetylhexosaminidase
VQQRQLKRLLPPAGRADHQPPLAANARPWLGFVVALALLVALALAFSWWLQQQGSLTSLGASSPHEAPLVLATSRATASPTRKPAPSPTAAKRAGSAPTARSVASPTAPRRQSPRPSASPPRRQPTVPPPATATLVPQVPTQASAPTPPPGTSSGGETGGVPLTPTAVVPAAGAAAPDEALRARIASMSVGEKVGQLMMVGFRGWRLAQSAELRALIEQYHVGGLVLVPNNVQNTTQLAAMIGESQQLALQSGAKLPLFVSINHEGGHVVHIEQGVTGFPGNMAVAASTQPEAAALAAAAMSAKELRLLGINMNLAPVLDVNDNPLNPIIGVRAFSDSPEVVARLGAETIRGLQDNGVVAVAKHFPGHGSTGVDSHVGLPVNPKEGAALEQVELPPFQAAVAAGVEAIMTAHIVVPAWEPTPHRPATISTPILTGILRERLGFDGIIMTDALDMGAIAAGGTQHRAAIEALKAGADMVLTMGPFEVHKAIHQAVIAAVEQGEIPVERLDASLLRVLRVKHRYNLVAALPAADLSMLNAPLNQVVADEIAATAITRLKDDARLVPLPAGTKRLLLVSPSTLPPAPTGQGTLFAQELRQRGFEVTELVFDLNDNASRKAAYTQAVQVAAQHDVVIYGEWEFLMRLVNQGDRWQERLLTALQGTGRPLVLVSWYDPGAVLKLPPLPTILLAYGGTPAQVRGVARVLSGELEAQGRLPLTLSLP